MKKWIFIDMIIFLLVAGISLLFAPDVFSVMIVCVMCVLIAMAFARGIWMVLQMADGFRAGTKFVETIKDVTSTDQWDMFKQSEQIFQNKFLDKLWTEYREQVSSQQMDDVIMTDIEESINDDVIALATWKSVMLQVPGSVTALGLIGTFLGLILGISGIAFSSVDAALSSITTLLSGIETAFYTSIVGVIFSLVFNISYKFVWNALLHEMDVFMHEFHKHILPEEVNRVKYEDRANMDKILECLERIPKDPQYFGGAAGLLSNSNASNENALMTEIFSGLKNHDFMFMVQPSVDLSSRNVIGGEALMRWNHSRLGIISPTVFIPELEKNGFIVKLDCQIWEKVCQTMYQWMQQGIRPVPISVNVSRMDILAMDVAEFFADLVNQYQIPPQYLQMEISGNAYMKSFEATHETEQRLRQQGFSVIINGVKGEYDALTLMAETNVDALKIDYQVLSEKIAENSSAIRDLLEQSRRTRVRLIVSGIENAKQLNTIKRAGFTEGRGFFLYKPVAVHEFEELIANIE